MAVNVSETFRENCYDMSKAQRILFMTDGLVLSNEDIAVGTTHFNLASITNQQVTFGETPSNTMSVALMNEDGHIVADSFVGKEFACHIGVEVDGENYLAPSHAISALNTGTNLISVHSEAPYVRGNVSFDSIMPELMNGDKCKMMLAYDELFFVVDDGEELHYAKHERTGTHSFGEYDTPSDTEIAMLDRLMNVSKYDAVAFYDGGMAEYTYVSEYVVPGEWAVANGSVVNVTDAIEYRIKSWAVGIGMTPAVPSVASGDFETWSDMKSRTWGGAKERTWGEISGYSIFKCVRYESVQYGVWTYDRPRRVNSAVLTLNGKDRMYKFDVDSAGFVNAIENGWFTPRQLITAISNYVGVPVGDLTSLNELADEILIDAKTYYQNKSLKDLLSYAFEVGGANGIIDRYGRLSASSADNTAVALPYVYVFDVADYTAHTIGKVLVYKEGEYTQYEEDDTVEDGAIYDWNDNPYFNNMLLSGSWFSNDVHKKYGGFRNAITTTDADYSLWCDDVYSWEDEDGNTYVEPIFSMTVDWDAYGRVTYTNSGEEERQYSSYSARSQGTTNTNDQNLIGFNKAQYANRLFFDEQGLTVQSNGLRIINENNEAVFYADDEGNLTLKGTVNADSGKIGEWDIVEDGIKCGGEEDYVFLGYTPDGSTPNVVSSMAWGITPDGVDVCKSIIEGAHINFESYEGDQLLASTGIGIDHTTGDIDADSPITMRNLTTTAQSANTALVSVDAYGKRKFYVVSSLRKMKDNIKTIEDASKKVDNLRGVSFTSKCEADDPNLVLYGFIAEEVEEAVPELASYTDGKLQGVQYDRVCALLVEDNKACHRRIEELEKRLEELERRLDK